MKNDSIATVVCRELGFPTEGAFILDDEEIKEGDVPILFSDIHCSGEEANLSLCSHGALGQVPDDCGGHKYDVKIKCIGKNVRTVNVQTFMVTIFRGLNVRANKSLWVRVAYRNYCC